MSLAPLAQRRQLDLDDAQPVVEVLAERALRDHRGEVAVRRGDHARVERHRPGVADALERALLQHAQQLGLQLERDLGDLVEEQRALAGELEPAGPVGDRAGERALARDRTARSRARRARARCS